MLYYIYKKYIINKKKEKIIMTKKEKFIKLIQAEIFDRADIWSKNYEEDWEDVTSFWEEFKNGKVKNSGAMTENGQKILAWMQENVNSMNNIFTSKEAAEALFTSGRSIAGSMRKLVNDGYVDKVGKDPVQYSLTDAGKNYQFDN
jgi:DNA-binding PadR family transcriptional regulator